MSASLVGSEMCIRDSSYPEHEPQPWRLKAARALPMWLRTPTAWPGAFRPVSYTHLTLPTICSV
eukprot:3355312-Alexandrium_andersonii.AAC.1